MEGGLVDKDRDGEGGLIGCFDWGGLGEWPLNVSARDGHSIKLS